MRSFHLPWIIGFCLCNLQSARAQEKLHFYFRHITASDGMLHNNVFSIVQDGKGFIWIATTNGLQRYDGSRFIFYPSMLSEKNTEYTIDAELRMDEKNNLLWLRKKSNIETINITTGAIKKFTTAELLTESPRRYDYSTKGYNGTYLLTNKLLHFYDSSSRSGSIENISLYTSGIQQASSLVADTNNNIIWAVRGAELFVFEKNRPNSIGTKALNGPKQLVKWKMPGALIVQIRYLLLDSRHQLWISTWDDKLFRYNITTGTTDTYLLSAIKSKELHTTTPSTGLLINCMFEDRQHTIWIGTENAGLLRYNQQANNFDFVTADDRNEGSIRYNYKIFCLFQDRQDNIWVGTDKGINIFNPYQQFFQSIGHNQDDPLHSIKKSALISCIQIPNADIYIGTWGGGVSVYDSSFHFKKNLQFSAPTEHNFTWSFAQFDADNLWIGCQHGYLITYNTQTGTAKYMRPVQMEASTIRCMTKDIHNNIYFGLHNGKIVKWDAAQKNFIASKDSSFSNNPVVHIFIDPLQNCWVSTEKGFKQFDPESMRFIHTWLPGKGSKSFSGINATGIESLNDSTLAIGSVYGGLNIFNKKHKTFSQLTIADGLPSDNVYALKQDKAGFLWITTDNMLFKLKPGERNIIFYKPGAGIINSSFESPLFYPLKDGRWLTSTATELIAFQPGANNDRDSFFIKTEITALNILGKQPSIDPLFQQKQALQLTYKENFFTVEFAALDFSGIQPINYYYRLIGIDNGWVSAGTRRWANYTDLQPGNYQFSVKAEKAGIFGPVTSFAIAINPPFWKTWWFLICMAALLIASIYLFVRWRIKNIKIIAAEKLKLQQLHADHYKNELELEQIINYFSSSLIDKNTIDSVLWDVAKNLMGRLGFEDCTIYLWNNEKSLMLQKAGFGPKGSVEKINTQSFEVKQNQGVVDYVIQNKEAVLIPDTSVDSRYHGDEMERQSDICVPIIYDDELIGIIDSGHHEKIFFTHQHLSLMSTIATLTANKIKSIEARNSLQEAKLEMLDINEKLLEARLEAIRSQMNPHFIFNCLNSIDNLIQNNENDKATTYLAKFAQLIRFILETSNHHVVACWKDMETLKLYLELEALRFDNQFTYTLDIASKISSGDYKVPPLVIQPFVENAIHHGLLNKLEADKKLLIQVTVYDNHLQYRIEDNGVGRQVSAGYNQRNKLPHQSMGMQLTSNRINLFNNIENGSVVVTDLYDSQSNPAGTRVEVSVYQH